MSTPNPAAAAILEGLLRVAADQGLDRVTVREVAAASGVAIGTVQHYFPTKDAMLAAAFAEVVRRIRGRVASVRLGPDVRANLPAVLRQLLPLDHERQLETRVQLAFTSRAATTQTLAGLQAEVLADVIDALTAAFAAIRPTDGQARCRLAAAGALALVDGLAMHAVSSGAAPDPAALTGPLELYLDSVLDFELRPGAGAGPGAP